MGRLGRNALTALLIPVIVTGCSHRPAPSAEAAQVAFSFPPSQPVPYTSGSLWNQAPESLFGNRRARRIGDILTITVEIDDQAEMGNEVDRARTTSEVFNVNSLLGVPEYAANVLPGGASLQPGVDFNRSRSFQGSGNIRREDRVTLRLAARVIDALPNGHLVIEGQQQVRVNHETRVLRAKGIVRPEDISRTNTIAHDKIAEAQIGYVGRGAIDREVKPRIGNRLLDAILPF